MKSLSILAAFLGGAVVGAAAGVLFAPEREKILVIKLLTLCVKEVSN